MSHQHGNQPVAAGKSSYDFVQVEKVFTALDLKAGTTLLDLACGRGAYSLHAAKLVLPKGMVHAMDLWEEGIALLTAELANQGIDNVKPAVVDAAQHIPLANNSVDCCLLATVLHDFVEINVEQNVLAELARVIKPGGLLGIVEYKVKDGKPGPPKNIRLSPEQTKQLMTPFHFVPRETIDVGPHNYLMICQKDS